MAIYHLEAKVIGRGAGRSACAASAYLSCSQILNDYDGIQHDYTRKSGLVWQAVFLPEYAPQEWSDRAVLWNAVEANEKTKDSRLAREFVVALPIELGKDQWTALLTEYIKSNFVAEGMCADVAIHDTDGHNPHAHIMLTVRPLDEQGKWQYKTEKEYLCVRDGEENEGSPLPSSRWHKPTAGRNSINTRWARKRCTWLPPLLKHKDLSVLPSTPKAPSMADRIPSQKNGTAMNSLSFGEKHGLIQSIDTWSASVPMPELTTAAMQTEDFWNSLLSTRASPPELWSGRDSLPTAVN